MSPPENKRILGVIPNYRTSPSLQNYEPLTAREKFKLASEDAFDRGTVVLAAFVGGEGQLRRIRIGPSDRGRQVRRSYWGAAYEGIS